MTPQRRNIFIGLIAAAAVVAILSIGSQLFKTVDRNEAKTESSKTYSDNQASSSKKSSSSSSESSSSNEASLADVSSTEMVTEEPVDPAKYGILQYMQFGVDYSPDGQGGYNLSLDVNNKSYMNANFDLSKFSIENGPSVLGAGTTVVTSLQNQIISLTTGAGDPGRATYNLMYDGQVITPITFQ